MPLPDSYEARDYLRPYLPFLPDVMQLPRDPEEEWWTWRDTQVHLDRLDTDDSPLKVILLHGGGGNGRVIGAFGALVHDLGYSYVAPDLPGFGLTVPGLDYDPEYRSWVALVVDLIDREQSRDGLPVVTFGASLGGMLAYNAAAASGKVRGVIATTLADPRNIEALDALARSKLWSRIGNLVMNVFPKLTDRLTIPARMISRMDAMTNDPAFSRVFVNDPLVGGARVKIGFYRSMAKYDPPIAPEAFDLCPLLLAHPAEDTWTPLSVSQPFYDKLGCDKELVMLEGCGHLPYEEPGVSQLREAVRRFLSRISHQAHGSKSTADAKS